MNRTKLKFKTADEVEGVFYEAFMRCDPEVIAALWADEGVVCVHPGSGAIVEYQAIIRSWKHILGNARQVEMRYTVISRILATDLAVHMVAEEMLTANRVNAVVLATNVYRKYQQSWLMVGHHASLVQASSAGQTLQ